MVPAWQLPKVTPNHPWPGKRRSAWRWLVAAVLLLALMAAAISAHRSEWVFIPLEVLGVVCLHRAVNLFSWGERDD